MFLFFFCNYLFTQFYLQTKSACYIKLQQNRLQRGKSYKGVKGLLRSTLTKNITKIKSKYSKSNKISKRPKKVTITQDTTKVPIQDR